MQGDLFGDLSQPGMPLQPKATGDRPPIWHDYWGLIEPPPPGGHTKDTIRARMLRLIAEAKAAETLPWPRRRLHTHVVTFPMMARWLPEEEGAQLLLEFMTEIERLRRAQGAGTTQITK